jgi:glutathione S-transferase
MKLFEFAPTRSIRARWTLQELGVEFEAVSVDLPAGEQRGAEFLALNPAGKVPVLVDGDMVLSESIAIVLYLAEKYREKGLCPDGLRGQAELMRWLLFTTTELEQPLWRITRHTNLYPEEKRLPAEIALAREDFGDMVKVLDQHMVDREFVVGDSVTLDWAQILGLLEDFPRLEGYMQRMYDRPLAPMRIKEAFASLKS